MSHCYFKPLQFGVMTIVGMLSTAAVTLADRTHPLPDGVSTLLNASVIAANPSDVPGAGVLSAEDEAFLDDLQKRGTMFFIDEADPVTGLMPDRARANGGPSNNVASTASVGFGLTALCVAAERGWISKQDAYHRSLRVLKFLNEKVPNHKGHYFHFMDMRTGERVWECELSNVDTALLMYGVIVVRQYFPDTELASLADEMYQRVDWGWLLDEHGVLHHGWKPESGILKAKWGGYSEGPPLILLLGLGSKKHPLPPETWNAWKREPVVTYAGMTFVQCPPLFTHQFPLVWFDLRGMHDGQVDYFRNAQLATIAMRQWSIDELSKKFPTYGENMWGLTASDYEHGYTAWGGPPAQGPIDGTVVPPAPAGSLAFTPRICLDVLKEMKAKHGEKAYVKYGFVDSFNPMKDWYNRDVIGIDIGPSILMAENARTGFVWKTFMSAPEAQAALKAAGFRSYDSKAIPAHTSLVREAKEVEAR